MNEPEELPLHLIDRDSERFVLGTVIAGGWEPYNQTLGTLEASDFEVKKYREVWGLVVANAAKGIEPSMSEVLRAGLEAKLPLTPGELMELTEWGVPGAPLAGWIQRLRRRTADRMGFRIGELIQGHTRVGISENCEEIQSAREQLAALERSLTVARKSTGTFGEIVEDCGGLDGLFRRPENLIEPPFGLMREVMNGGLAPQSVTVLGARPSDGKTSLGIQWAISAASAGRRTLVFSLEMAKPQLVKRMLSCHGAIPLTPLIRGLLSGEQRAAVRRVTAELEDKPLALFCDTFTLRAIEAEIAKAKPEFVVLDYLGLVESGMRVENRNQDLSFISRRLKQMAMQYGFALLALHQLSRSSVKEARRPTCEDLRDSGSIEQDASNVLLLYCPAPQDPNKKDEVEVIIGKQRDGIRNMVLPMTFKGEFVRFYEREL